MNSSALQTLQGLFILLCLLLTPTTATDDPGAERDHSFMLDSGVPVNFDEWQGKWVLINFWAEWCPVCRIEVEKFNVFHEHLELLNAVVIGVNISDLDKPELARYKQAFRIKYPDLIESPAHRWGESTPSFVPTTYVINRFGALNEILEGRQTQRTYLDAIEYKPRTNRED